MDRCADVRVVVASAHIAIWYINLNTKTILEAYTVRKE